MEWWLALAFAAGALVGAACGVVVMAVLMVSRDAEPVSAQWQDLRLYHPGMGAR